MYNICLCLCLCVVLGWRLINIIYYDYITHTHKQSTNCQEPGIFIYGLPIIIIIIWTLDLAIAAPTFYFVANIFFFWFSLDLHSNNKCSNQKHRRHQILLLLLLLGLMDMRNSNKKLDRIVLVLGNQSFLSLCVMCLNIKKMNFCCCFVTRQLHAHTHKHTHQIPALLTKWLLERNKKQKMVQRKWMMNEEGWESSTTTTKPSSTHNYHTPTLDDSNIEPNQINDPTI